VETTEQLSDLLEPDGSVAAYPNSLLMPSCKIFGIAVRF
jgi:hypothetical protein